MRPKFPDSPDRIVAAMQHCGSTTAALMSRQCDRDRRPVTVSKFGIGLKVEPDTSRGFLLSQMTDAVDPVVRDDIWRWALGVFALSNLSHPARLVRRCIRECRRAINDKKLGRKGWVSVPF